MRKTASFLMLIWATFYVPAARAQEICTIGLGDTVMHLMISGEKAAGIRFLNLHDDENTSVEAALKVMKEQGGGLFELRHSGERLVTFTAGSRQYQFDPNRIFTPEGRRATLKRYGSVSQAAEKAVAAFADSLLSIYDIANVSCIITLHNNTDNDFSAKSYLPGAIYEKEARKVYLEPGADADDFAVVTRRRFYRYYKKQGVNVVLQSKKPTDDGSLSVYAEWNEIPYINLEAQTGHLEQQAKMIALTYALLERSRGFFSWFGKP